jgi:hypothetical protein
VTKVEFKPRDSFFARSASVVKAAWRSRGPIAEKFFVIRDWLAWEGGMLWSPDRGRVGFSRGIQDPNEANDVRSREEIIRKVHEFERNDALTNRLLDVFEIFTVGAGGMRIIPASSDPDWNAKRQPLWERWCRNPDLTSLQTFGTLQGLISRRWPADGNVYVLKTRSDRPPFRPRIQILEASRLSTPNDQYGNPNIVDGVEIDSKGRPMFYWFRFTENGENLYRRIPAASIIVVGKPMRPGEYRQMSFFAPVLNKMQDRKELATFAMRKAKYAAQKLAVYNTINGDLPTSQDYRNARLTGIPTQTSSGTDTTKTKLTEIQQVTGSQAIALQIGEGIEFKGSETPNQVEQAHWDILANDICAGFGISKIFVYPNSMQGTVVRADLDIATTWFRAHTSILIDVFLEIYRFVTDEECKIEHSISDRPHDWEKATVRPPRAPNVDVGRNSAAMIAELAAGATNFRNIYGPLGMDAREELSSLMDDLAWLKSEAERRKIPVEWVRKEIADAAVKDIQKAQDDQQKQEDAELKTA